LTLYVYPLRLGTSEEKSGQPTLGWFGGGRSGSSGLSPRSKAKWERLERGGVGGKGQPPSKGKGMTAGMFDSLGATGYIE